MRNSLVAAFICLALVCPVAAQEDESGEPLEARIAQMNEQIEVQEQELSELDIRTHQQEAKLKSIRLEIDRVQKEERGLNTQLKSINDERSDIQREIKELEMDAMRVRAASTERLKVLYMHPREELLAFLVRQTDSEALARNGYYLSVVRSYDLKILERMREIKLIRNEKRLELDTLSASKERVVSDIKARREQLQAKAAEQEPVVKSLREDKKRREQLVQELRAKVLRFETVLAGLTGGPNSETAPEGHARKKEKATGSYEQAVIPGYDGPGLKGKRGSLTSPAQGKVITGYGKTVSGENQGFSSISKGIEYQVAPALQIKAIAAGEVIFVGKMPGIGPIVILDHGERYYSLYGRLDRIEVDKGDEVGQGASLGTASNPDDKGRNFYFEVRRNGSPVNPGDFIMNK